MHDELFRDVREQMLIEHLRHETPITPEDLGTATNDYDVVMPGDMLIGVDPGDEDGTDA